MNAPVQSMPPLFAAAIKSISDPRFGPYLRSAGGDAVKGLELYHWNMRASAAIYQSLHIVEIALRNTLDEHLSAWNEKQTNADNGQLRSADWLLDSPPMLVRLVRQENLDEAKRRANNHVNRRSRHNQARRVAAHCDVLAQMTFGSWRFLLKAPRGRKPDSGSVYLWNHVFPSAFPNMTRTPQALDDDVVRIYDARNRIAHLEPILDSQQVKDIRDSMKRVLSDIGVVLPVWFDTQEKISKILV